MFDFHKLKVYSKTRNLNNRVFELLKNKKIDRYLDNQFKRATTSIVLNIAEGTGKISKKDRRNFYVIAKGSVYECISILDLLLDQKIIDNNVYQNLFSDYEEISKMLHGLIKNLS